MKIINVTKTFLPPIDKYKAYIDRIWQTGQLTNEGPLLKEFESRASNYLGVANFQFVSNGTLALQLALEAVGAKGGEVITTPFSYVASTSAILWEGSSPVFVDIDPSSFCIDPNKIEAAITPNTVAILAVHVFGNPCNVEMIDEIAKRHNIKVIYDAAHAFGVKYRGESLLSFGDISTCSFHSTKVFHTIEGGCVISSDDDVSGTVELMKRFGHNGDNHTLLGINAKASEFQAAMGLVNLDYIDENIKKRKAASDRYTDNLQGRYIRPEVDVDFEYNYAYYPIIFDSKDELESAVKRLNLINIYPRRYFYPSLNTIKYIGGAECPVSESVSERVLCLPLYSDINPETIDLVCMELLHE